MGSKSTCSKKKCKVRTVILYQKNKLKILPLESNQVMELISTVDIV